jgi:hypothetical protein
MLKPVKSKKEDFVTAIFKVITQHIKVKGLLSNHIMFVVTLDIRS